MIEKRISVVSFVAIFLFVAAVLMPQGVGLRLAPLLPNLDLPRIAMLAMIALLLFRIPKMNLAMFSHAPRTLCLLVILALWQFLSAFASASPKWSTVWAVGNVVTYWGFAFAVIVLMGTYKESKRVTYVLIALAALLSLWSAYEFITQTKLVAERNIYGAAERMLFSISLRRRVVVDGAEIDMPYMSIGPYAINLILAGALCALGGFLLQRHKKSNLLHIALVALFVFAVLSTQSRAGIIALVFMVVVSIIWAKSHMERLCIFAAATVAAFMFALIFGPEIFYLSFFNKFSAVVPFVDDNGVAGATTAKNASTAAAQMTPGTLEARWYGIQLLWAQVQKFWVFGYGPGSLFDSERVVTPLKIYSDSGSFFGFLAELGVVGGSLLAALVLASLIEGISSRDPKVQAATIGLMGFCLTALVSLTPWPWGVALVMVGMIESWSKGTDVPRRAVVRRMESRLQQWRAFMPTSIRVTRFAGSRAHFGFRPKSHLQQEGQRARS